MNILAVLAIVTPLAVYADLANVNARSWEESIALAQKTVAKLSVEEKVKLSTGLGWSYTQCVGNTAAIPSINFPGLCLQDSPTGIRFARNVSAFPASLNVASTFDHGLMYNNGRFMGEELRDKGVNVHLSPVANMMRTPQGGRGWEAQGADPFLTGVSVTQQINGIQSNGVQATLKHYVLNDQEKFRQDRGDIIIDKKTLMDYYIRPFKMAIDHSGPASIMCSYNSVNGVNACDNPVLMKILKEELGFKGYVMSDWWATHTELDGLNAGMDMVMPGSKACCDAGNSTVVPAWWGETLVSNINNSTVKMARVDDFATRILTGWYRQRQDENYPATNFNSWFPEEVQLNVQRNHKAHIREVGAASAILLKNSGVLPLTAKSGNLALIGSDAITPPSGINAGGDHGVNPDGTLAQGWGSGTTNFPYLVAPQEGITAAASPLGLKVSVASNNWDIPAVEAAAAAAGTSIVFVNANSGEGYITIDGNEGDRKNLTLWNNGDRLVEAAAAKGPTVVVIHAPGAVDMPWINLPNVKAVIMAMLPGQESGNAIADVLFGAVNPSGRLPFTIGHNITDYHTQIDMKNPIQHYSEGGYFDYRWNQKNNIAPLFAFGHGLSYASFAYANTAATQVCKGSTKVQVDVSNTGAVDGHEVVQVYLGYPKGVDQPAKQLKGFSRVMIGAGKTEAVSIEITPDFIQIYDDAKNTWFTPEGTYTVFVGASSADLRGEATFVIDSACTTAPTDEPSASASADPTAPASSGYVAPSAAASASYAAAPPASAKPKPTASNLYSSGEIATVSLFALLYPIFFA
ncbi:hypothetical protein CcCBS67573_g05777 [Chytriomyces confervae]|uniref:Probable beta-glucosidase G n=1 Tax=Chytriomyces confervae TaxID=246404 RepID=A0A507F8D0_9FUNG|nr:hypothetical protein CcCBS67573_g05777 [Chytriomyces confervae]